MGNNKKTDYFAWVNEPEHSPAIYCAHWLTKKSIYVASIFSFCGLLLDNFVPGNFGATGMAVLSVVGATPMLGAVVLQTQVDKNKPWANDLVRKIVGALRKDGAFEEVPTITKGDAVAKYQVTRWLLDPKLEISPFINNDKILDTIFAIFEEMKWNVRTDIVSRLCFDERIGRLIMKDSRFKDFLIERKLRSDPPRTASSTEAELFHSNVEIFPPSTIVTLTPDIIGTLLRNLRGESRNNPGSFS